MSILSKIFGDSNSRYVKSLTPHIASIDRYEAELTALSDSDFPLRTQALRERVSSGATLDSVLPEAFALVREASRRTLGLRHYDVQLIGGIALHQGKIAEMRTGEGKTLVATLPAYLNALSGKGVHVVTVNDYLARRDAVWMGTVYAFLGLSIGVINSQNTSYVYDPAHKRGEDENEEAAFKVQYEFLRPSSRKEAYAADITYGTNNEYGFDYLRDNLVQNREQIVHLSHVVLRVSGVNFLPTLTF